jgi:hypothetical protein
MRDGKYGMFPLIKIMDGKENVEDSPDDSWENPPDIRIDFY